MVTGPTESDEGRQHAAEHADPTERDVKGTPSHGPDDEPSAADAVAVMAAALQDAGASRIEAALVSCLLAHPEADTGLLLKVTRLRQPEVSTGMRELRERGWVDTEPQTREGRGRPMHRHSLAIAPEAVREHYAEAVRDRIETQQRALDGLQSVVDQASERTPSRSARMTASQRPRNRPHSTTPG